jgi:hypothetical protein
MKALQATDLFAVRRGIANYKVDWSDMNQVVSVGTTPPAAPRSGALWLNTSKGVVYVFDGTYWVGK